jgi:hypothetical protein
MTPGVLPQDPTVRSANNHPPDSDTHAFHAPEEAVLTVTLTAAGDPHQ